MRNAVLGTEVLAGNPIMAVVGPERFSPPTKNTCPFNNPDFALTLDKSVKLFGTFTDSPLSVEGRMGPLHRPRLVRLRRTVLPRRQ